MTKNMQLRVDKLYDFIVKYKNENGFCPSVREMCNELEINSTSTITYYLNHLVKVGKIRRMKSKNRAIDVVMPETEAKYSTSYTENPKIPLELISSYQPIPMLGTITAGQPILAVENFEEVFYMPTGLFRGDDLFMLVVKGDSMIDAGIMNGDRVVIKRQDTANNGDIVAALIDDSATVKRFFKENGRFRLQPENKTMDPMYFEEVSIIGKVVGLIRNL